MKEKTVVNSFKFGKFFLIQILCMVFLFACSKSNREKINDLDEMAHSISLNNYFCKILNNASLTILSSYHNFYNFNSVILTKGKVLYDSNFIDIDRRENAVYTIKNNDWRLLISTQYAIKTDSIDGSSFNKNEEVSTEFVQKIKRNSPSILEDFDMMAWSLGACEYEILANIGSASKELNTTSAEYVISEKYNLKIKPVSLQFKVKKMF